MASEQPLPPQVYVLDDDPMLLAVMERLLARAGYRVAAFRSPSTFLEEAPLTPPCCLLLDVQLPEMTGVEIQDKLARSPSPPSIVFVSGASDVPTSVRAMKAGAIDFLQKPFENADLLRAIALALQHAESRMAQDADAAKARAKLAKLTPRERQVCDGVVRGLRSKEIADELGAAVKTINVHRSRVMAKLGVTTVASLVRLMALAGTDSWRREG